MEMSMNLSEKDKNTLIIVVVALLIFGIAFLGIKPAFTSIKETKATNDELSAQKKTMQTEIANLPTYQTNLTNAINDYNTTAARVFDTQTNDKIHDAVVAMVQNNGLEIVSLSIADVTDGTLQNYQVTDEGVIGGVTDGSIKLAYVNVSVYGSVNSIIGFINYLNNTEGTFLQTVSFAESNDVTTVSIPMYMVVADSF